MVGLIKRCTDLERENNETLKHLTETAKSLDSLKRSDLDLREKLRKSDRALRQQATAQDNAAAEAQLRIQETEQALAIAQQDLRAERQSVLKNCEKIPNYHWAGRPRKFRV